MNAFNIEFPSICLRALLKGYNTCGVENQDAHYSGMLDVRVDGCVDWDDDDGDDDTVDDYGDDGDDEDDNDNDDDDDDDDTVVDDGDDEDEDDNDGDDDNDMLSPNDVIAR